MYVVVFMKTWVGCITWQKIPIKGELELRMTRCHIQGSPHGSTFLPHLVPNQAIIQTFLLSLSKTPNGFIKWRVCNFFSTKVINHLMLYTNFHSKYIPRVPTSIYQTSHGYYRRYKAMQNCLCPQDDDNSNQN